MISDLILRMKTATAIQARGIWREAKERGVSEALRRAWAFGYANMERMK